MPAKFPFGEIIVLILFYIACTTIFKGVYHAVTCATIAAMRAESGTEHAVKNLQPPVEQQSSHAEEKQQPPVQPLPSKAPDEAPVKILVDKKFLGCKHVVEKHDRGLTIGCFKADGSIDTIDMGAVVIDIMDRLEKAENRIKEFEQREMDGAKQKWKTSLEEKVKNLDKELSSLESQYLRDTIEVYKLIHSDRNTESHNAPYTPETKARKLYKSDQEYLDRAYNINKKKKSSMALDTDEEKPEAFF